MILHLLYFCLICHPFVLNHAEPLKGEQVWPANPENFPFVASLGLKNPTPSLSRGHFCGGTLITQRHVLTAAHCLMDYSRDRIDVIIGEADLKTARFRYEVEGWITYDNWARGHGIRIELPLNDVAILKLSSPVDRPGIKPVVISESNDAQVYGRSAVVLGWGVTNNGSHANELLSARVTIWSYAECRRKIKIFTNRDIYAAKNSLCSSATPYALTDLGDSGGPVLGQNNALLGVIRSTGPRDIQQWGNCSSEFLIRYRVNMHSSVHYYRDFIENVAMITTRPKACG